jgi:hypothetical protein
LIKAASRAASLLGLHLPIELVEVHVEQRAVF